jgi:squalene-hopene/tetraprenyl-beta-curcumene cyclase
MNFASNTEHVLERDEFCSICPQDTLDFVVEDAAESLKAVQAHDGHWCFELEADSTIPAEYILLQHFLGEIDPDLEVKIAAYLRRHQGIHGGWPLFHDGNFNLSASVKAYFALRLVGDSADEPHMRRARAAILEHGGASRTNVFTRYSLALFGQVPWRAVPTMPIEIMLLPRWFPFHLSKVSYWSRTVMVPLLILAALKPLARNPRKIDIRELFVTPPEQETDYLINTTGSRIGKLFLGLDKILRWMAPHFSKTRQRRAIAKAVDFITARLNGDDGLGGIFPAIANSVMALDTLGYAREHIHFAVAKAAINKLLVVKETEAYCQPCLSPVWDTCLAVHAMLDSDAHPDDVQKATDWLASRQILDCEGDWRVRRPNLRPGGWAFQYRNAHYPDVDDTAVVVMALHRADPKRYEKAISRGVEWVIGMQCKNGGWGAFDPDNTHFYLDHIPFADHGALLDPPTVDVTARCIGMLAQVGRDRNDPIVARGIAYLRREQEDDGSWFGRWGTNYIYGTWSALCAFNAVGEDRNAPHIRRAVDWLLSQQRSDGGWGEDGVTYWHDCRGHVKVSTPSQTAWALLGLMAAGVTNHAAVERGVQFLLQAPREGPRWREESFTAVGFPRVFYLRYHGYAAYFPLWALARYRAVSGGEARTVPYGI